MKETPKVTDLDVVKAHPISVVDFDISKYIVVDLLNLSLSKPIFSNKIKIANGYEKTIKRKLIYSYDNGKEIEAGVVTITTKKVEKRKNTSYLVSYNSKASIDQIKSFLQEDYQKKLSQLDEFRKLKKVHTNDDRLMAVVIVGGKQKLVTADSREDFKRMANKDRTLSYKLVSEKFGFNYPKSFDDMLKQSYPKAKVKTIRKKVEEYWKHNSYDYKKIAKLLTGKSKTKNSVKVFAKRFLSKVCGDRIWERT